MAPLTQSERTMIKRLLRAIKAFWNAPAGYPEEETAAEELIAATIDVVEITNKRS